MILDSELKLGIGIGLESLQSAAKRPITLDHASIAIETRLTQRDLMSVFERESLSA